MKIARLFLVIHITLSPVFLTAQQSIIVIDSDLTGGTYEKVARNTIFLKPGFSYDAINNNTFWAHIDETLPQPAITPVECAQSSSFPVDIDPSLPVGAIPGQAGVSPSGAATYTVPIEVPPAAQGMQPNLSVVFNSQAGNGIMGMGWNLSGLSAITRVPKNIYNDGKVEEIKLDYTDNFAFDGQRLILTNGGLGEEDSEYRTEVETYVRITAHESSGSGPKWFKVETKDGLTMEFGNTNHSSVKPTGRSDIIIWHLNKVYDTFGNYIEFNWEKITNDPWSGRASTIDEVYISSIKYGANVNDVTPACNNLVFRYSKREDIFKNRYSNIGDYRNTLLLKEIEIISDNEFVRSYKFEYLCNGVSKLSSIDLQGANGDFLNKTAFDWGSETNGSAFSLYQLTVPFTPPEFFNVNIMHDDISGDGKIDLIYKYPNDNKWEIFIYNDSFDPKYERKYSAMLDNVLQLFTGDIDSDGKSSVFILENASGNDRLKEYQYNTATKQLELVNTIDMPYSNCNSVQFGDFDGDAVQDVIVFDANKNILGILVHNFSTILTVNHSNNPNRTELIDINGNGKTDIMVVDNGGASAIYEFISGNILTRIDYNSDFPGSGTNWLKGEFDGDNRTDFLVFIDGGWRIYRANGLLTGYSIQENLPVTNRNLSQFIALAVLDINNDGYDDIFELYEKQLYINGTQHEQYRKIHYSTGNGNFRTADDGTMIYNRPPVLRNRTIVFSDLNNDLMVDYTDIQFSQTLNISIGTFKSFPYHHTNLLTSIGNGNNIVSEFSYSRPIAKNNSNPEVFIEYLNRPPIYIVNNFNEQAGGLIANNQSFSFKNPYIHKQGKGFLGFSKVEIKDNISGFTQKSTYRMESSMLNVCLMLMQASSDPPSPALFSTLYQPILEETSIMKTNDEILSKITYNFDVDITDPCLHLDYELFYISLKTKTTENYLQNLTTTTNYSYDNYGNPLTVTTDYNGDAGVHVSNTYTGFGDWWCPKSRLQQSTVTKTRPGESDFPATTRFEYNTEGALTNKFSFYNQPKQVTENYDDFDVFGNPRKITVSAAGLETRQTTLEYNDGFGRFITKKTNPLGYSEEFTYDGKTGNMLTYTDINELFTRNKYDGFGRLETVKHPNGNTTQITREFEIDGDQLYSVQEVTGGQPEQKTWYDHLGRKIKTGTKGFDGNMVYSDIQYTPKGEVYKVSEPYTGSPSQYTEYGYLDDGRVDDITYPTGVTETYTYTQGSTEVTVSSSNGTWKTTKTDGTGALIMAKDAGGQIDYTYFAHGGIKNITYGDVETNMTYDIYGRQETLTDLDAGTINYSYNAFGELENQTDARGNNYNMFYDKLGRLDVKKLGTTVVADYTYDNAVGKGIGFLAKVEGNNNITYTFEYDDLSKMIKRTENIQGVVSRHSYTYDGIGRLKQTIYPSGFGIENKYQNGYLQEVIRTDNGNSIWKGEIFNIRNQPKQYLNGNNLRTTLNYDDYGFLTSIQTPGIQNLEYNFDTQTGNLNYRKDVPKNLQENFTYDNLMKNRLETWQVNSGGKDTIIYYANGNIDSKTLLGSYQYESSRPHAVTGVDNTNNWIETQEQTISYTPFNKVEKIRQSDYKLQIIYGPDNERKKTILYRNANSPVPLKSTEETINWMPYKTKYFVGGIYEEEVIDAVVDNHRELNYIFGGDGLSAIFVKDNGGENLYYIHKDHLGSYQSITNASGALVEEMNFDPWGNRRNPADWTFPAAAEYHLFDRGFTGHEHLDQFSETNSLINMNGRFYDPVLGRFLSPDNYIQAPDYTQSMNRYSYCLNNPLIYTDPSGEFWGWIGAMFGNYVIGGMDNWVNKGMSFNQAFSPQYNPVVLGGSYSPGNNTWSNSQVTAQQMPGILGEGQQTISNYLAGFGGWDGDAPMFSDLSMPDLELGGIELIATPQYNQTPSRINFNGSGDEVLTGLTEWIDYLYTGSFSLRKTSYGKYYSIDDMFYNLPGASMGGYSPAGDIKGKFYGTSSNNKFSIGIHRMPNNSMKGGSTFLKGMRYGVATNGPGKTYFWLFLHNGTRSGTSYNKVFQLQFYGEDFYSPIRNSILNKIPTH